MGILRKGAGLLAAVILALTGTALVGGNLLLGGTLLVVGAVAAVVQLALLIKNRDDPYDLSKLNDTPPALPGKDEQDLPEDRSGYCPVCGTFIESPFEPCPKCGSAI